MQGRPIPVITTTANISCIFNAAASSISNAIGSCLIFLQCLGQDCTKWIVCTRVGGQNKHQILNKFRHLWVVPGENPHRQWGEKPINNLTSSQCTVLLKGIHEFKTCIYITEHKSTNKMYYKELLIHTYVISSDLPQWGCLCCHSQVNHCLLDPGLVLNIWR